MTKKQKQKSEAIARLQSMAVGKQFVTMFTQEGIVPLFSQYAYVDRFGTDGLDPDALASYDESVPAMFVSDDPADINSVVFAGKLWDSFHYGLPGAPEEDDINAIIQDFESDGSLVYAMHIMDTPFARLLTLFYVSSDKSLWEYERYNAASCTIIAQAGALEDFDARSERGLVGIFSASGRLFRWF
jgi:hypothetical protein